MNTKPHFYNGRSSYASHPKGSPAKSRICPVALGKQNYHNDDSKLLNALDEYEYPSHYATPEEEKAEYMVRGMDRSLAISLLNKDDLHASAPLCMLNAHFNYNIIDWANISPRKAKKLAKRGIFAPYDIHMKAPVHKGNADNLFLL